MRPVPPSRSAWVLLLLLGGLLGCATRPAREPSPRASAAPATASLPAPIDPGGVGSLEARTSDGDPSLVELAEVRVVAEQRGDMAELAVTHVFRNDSEQTLEGTFRFPMPDGALITGLAMMIDGKLMEGELVPREKARRVYESIVDTMQDPALLEWEHGSVFKMRVFPIEPRREKVVVMRYLTPLKQSGDRLELVQSTRTAAGSPALPRLTIDWRGQRVLEADNVGPGLLSFPASPVSRILREPRAEATYAAVRVSPDWRRLAPPPLPPAKNWFVLVDTSRSALEEMPRVYEALAVLLSKLPPSARFRLVTYDLDVTPAPDGLTLATPDAIARAVERIRRVEPDGASDLGRALTLIGELSRQTTDSALLYLGDCEPTWGVTKTDDLLALRAAQLPGVPLYPVLLGSSVNDQLASELAARSGGRRARVRRREDLDAFAATLATGAAVLHDIRVQAPPGTEVLATGPLFIEEGGELRLLVKSPAGRDPLQGVSVEARVAGRSVDLLPRVAAEETRGLDRRFGAALVRKLEQAGRPESEVVAASLAFGVISRHTSFLVLESEQAYAQHAIERATTPAGDPPRVTGANLESSSGTEISADRVQPGDPEIYVDAPRDALGVQVDFPFGERKRGSYDPEARGGRGAWMVRFLVPRHTPEGEYEALVHVKHADGQLETRRSRYTVDNTPPALKIELRAAARQPGMIEVLVTQAGEARAADLKRVELRTPGGRVYQLTAVRWATFRVFVPREELAGGTLRVVGIDQALNHAVQELALP